MQIRLTKKLANCLDGIDVAAYEAGDVFEVTPTEGELLIAEGWAVDIVALNDARAKASTSSLVRAEARRLCEVWEQPARHRVVEQDLRRAEDIVRDELRDSRAHTVPAQKDERSSSVVSAAEPQAAETD